jgi:DNA-binding XRE family transcriptional regulator
MRPYFSGQRFSLSFEEIESILAKPLPKSARTDRHWWSNRRSRLQAGAWLCADCRVVGVDFVRGEVRFQKPVLYRWRQPDGSLDWDRFEIRSLRRHMHLTQAAFAQLIGVLQPTVSYLETGRHTPTDAINRSLNLLAQKAKFFRPVGQPKKLDAV